MKQYYLTPGPSELYFTVPDHLHQALRENVGAISHRGKAYEAIHRHAVEGVRALLNVPTSHHIVFTNTATEVWERVLQNCVAETSFHLVNGSFSKRFYEFAALLQKKGTKLEAPLGEGFDLNTIEVPAEAELMCVTHNETSTGVSVPEADIHALKDRYPDKLLVVDAVSSVPFPTFDFTKIDSLFFSVQKGMGLPAGLGVWIFNDACARKSEELAAKGYVTGTYHSIPSFLEKAAVNQTPATPNVLGIYLLGKVCEDMLRRGIQVIRQETRYKAALLYNLYEQHPDFEVFVKEKNYRSQTVAVANIVGKPASDIIDMLKKQGMVVGSGYGKLKATQIRIANFPTHSKELIERLVDLFG